MSMLSHKSSSAKNTTYLARGLTPTRFNTCESGTSIRDEWSSRGLMRAALARVEPRRRQPAREVMFGSSRSTLWESIDMSDAWHPQTLLAYGMNGEACPRRTARPCASASLVSLAQESQVPGRRSPWSIR